MATKKNTIKYFVEQEGYPPKIYYHYTTLEALFSIVSTQTIRLTSLKSSNDKKELSYSPETFLYDFMSVCNAEKDIEIKQKFLDIYDDTLNNKTNFLKVLRITRNSKPYAFCLAKKRDNLTHWDRYAASGTGVCIAINLSSINVQIQRSGSDILGLSIFDIGDTIYSESARQYLIRQELLGALKVQENLLKNNSRLYNRLNYMYAATICKKIIKFAKNSSFVDEDEIRLYHESNSISDTLGIYSSMTESIPEIKPMVESFNNYISSIGIDNEQFSLSKQGIRGYREICLSDVWGSGVIPEIILGPMCSQNKYELKQFLKKYNLGDTKVTVSKVPIR